MKYEERGGVSITRAQVVARKNRLFLLHGKCSFERSENKFTLYLEVTGILGPKPEFVYSVLVPFCQNRKAISRRLPAAKSVSLKLIVECMLFFLDLIVSQTAWSGQ